MINRRVIYNAGSIDELINVFYEPDRDILLDKLELYKQDKEKKEYCNPRILHRSGKLKWIVTLIKSDYNDIEVITGLQ